MFESDPDILYAPYKKYHPPDNKDSWFCRKMQAIILKSAG